MKGIFVKGRDIKKVLAETECGVMAEPPGPSPPALPHLVTEDTACLSCWLSLGFCLSHESSASVSAPHAVRPYLVLFTHLLLTPLLSVSLSLHPQELLHVFEKALLELWLITMTQS